MVSSTQMLPAITAGRKRRQKTRSWSLWISMASRVFSIAAVVFLLAMLPWLTKRDPAVAIFRARYAESDLSEEALEAIRQELGLDAGPFGVFFTWLGNVLQGDWGVSWVSRKPVMPGMLEPLGVSLTLMAFALIVVVIVAIGLSIPTFVRGLRGRSDRTGGGAAAVFTAMPEFLLASLLLVVVAVWLRWLPPYGWSGVENAVLPALAMGIPAGGFIGRLFSDALAGTFSERWVGTWTVAGFSKPRIIGAAIRRTLPGVLPQVGLVLVGLTAGAVAVEQVFSIPGLGRATLGAAQSQDLPVLQAGVILMMIMAVAFGLLAALGRQLMLGPALRAKALPTAVPKTPSPKRAWILPIAAFVLLAVVILAGLPRDPFEVVHDRLATPSWDLPLGADASGRDILARISHGALKTIGVAAVVTGIVFLLGIVIGMFPNLAAGPIEITNAAPPVIAGLIIAAVFGPSATGAALAVAAVSWAPLAAHTAALVSEVRAQPHVQVAPVLGVGRVRLMLRYILPSVIGPVFRHAALRLPGIALAIAALGFLGLGPQPPAPEWGLVLSEGMQYVERSPLVVLVPAGALAVLSIFAVSLSSLTIDFRGGRGGRIKRVKQRRAAKHPPRTEPTMLV